MTRSDYELLAMALARHRAKYVADREFDKASALEDFTKSLAYELSLRNPRFNRDRFCEVAGID